MSPRSDVLISARELMGLLSGDNSVSVLDVRWQLSEPDGTAAYRAGHLPGAVYVSLEDELTDHAVSGRGRHPLPTGRAVTAAARRWGLRSGVPVVVYDDWNRAGSARAWWVLTAAGIPDVRILDGGLAAWLAGGGALETDVPQPPPGDLVAAHDDLYAGALPTLTAEQVGGRIGTLLDARAPDRFRGDVEPVDPVAGHIPGARNLPSTAVLDDDGSFLSGAELNAVLSVAGIEDATPAGVYCGSGITAAVVVAALAAAGQQPALFPGSWSQWSSDPSRPVAVGPE